MRKRGRWEAWLARNFDFFARRWREDMDRELETEALTALEFAKAETRVAAHAFIATKSRGDLERVAAAESALLRAVLHEKNCLVAYVRQTNGEEAANRIFEAQSAELGG